MKKSDSFTRKWGFILKTQAHVKLCKIPGGRGQLDRGM